MKTYLNEEIVWCKDCLATDHSQHVSAPYFLLQGKKKSDGQLSNITY
jgi:hypothetical protein